MEVIRSHRKPMGNEDFFEDFFCLNSSTPKVHRYSLGVLEGHGKCTGIIGGCYGGTNN